VNNYDISSTGVGVEVHAFLDSADGEWFYEENMATIKNTSWGSGSVTECITYLEGTEEPIDCVTELFQLPDDRRAVRRAVYERWLAIDTFANYTALDFMREYAHKHYDQNTYTIDWHEAWFELLQEDYEIEDFAWGRKCDLVHECEGSKHLYGAFCSQGYSQSDYSHVIYKLPDEVKDHGKRLSSVMSIAHNALWDSLIHVYVGVTQDGVVKEYYLSELVKDRFEYDKDEVIAVAKTTDMPAEAVAFLKNNLPEYLSSC